eukprot:5426226-Amphidinium_carterae.3
MENVRTDDNMNPDSERLQSDMAFHMVAELAFTMRVTTERDIEENDEVDEIDTKTLRRLNKEDKDKMYNEENKDNDKYDKSEKEMQTLNINEMQKGTISMLGKNPPQDEHKVAFPNTVRRLLPTIQRVGR